LSEAQRHDPTARVPWGYVSLTATRSAIYGLYSGRIQKYDRDRAGYGSWLHEFGWDGRLKAIYELDADGIAISAQDQDLYMIIHYPKPGVRRYTPPIIQEK